ncbi:hypothetical protein AOD73_24190 [Pseudomonas aeruginosa]|nr:hypothetical protein AOD73_24190 [Pseudomonas aeruginosa]
MALGIGTCDAHVVDEFDLLAFRSDFGAGALDVPGLHVATEEQQVGGGDEVMSVAFWCSSFTAVIS